MGGLGSGPKPGQGAGRKPSPCGTVAKYQWHRKRGENCPTCRFAAAAAKRAKYKPKRPPQTSRERKVNARRFIIDMKLERGACLDCGMIVTEDNYYCFDFDHRDPQNKDFAVSTKSRNFSRATLLDEINKCDLVCANCHRHRTMRQFRLGVLTGRKHNREPRYTAPTLFDLDGLHG